MVAEKTRYSDEELQEFEVLISQKIAKAQEELNLYLAQLNDQDLNEETRSRNIDDGVGTVELERLNTLAARQRKHLQHLENALIRVQNKVYGVCRETGRLIPKERLRAVPHATLCVDAKNNRKRAMPTASR